MNPYVFVIPYQMCSRFRYFLVGLLLSASRYDYYYYYYERLVASRSSYIIFIVSVAAVSCDMDLAIVFLSVEHRASMEQGCNNYYY